MIREVKLAKEFRTTEELVELLESRGVVTDAKTQTAIERESYYAIVNGYKNPFLDFDAMKTSSDDVFVKGTRFEWMYDLFLFDRDLRMISFKYLTRAEAVMRTAVSYAFCEAHREQNAYLDETNFCKPDNYLVPRTFKGNKAAQQRKNLDKLMKMLNGKIAVNSRTRDFIRHYVNKHGSVPLWVLANDLTFGNVVHFYQLMQENDRRYVCTIVARVAGRKQKEQGFLSERELLRSATILNDFRNYCALDERLYCARSGDATFSLMMARLTDLLPREEVEQFLGELAELYIGYSERLHGMEFRDLLAEMGFPIEEIERDTENEE